ncbi:hypothetical protein [Pseudomonas sp. zfem003]|uniref:hypothetical protein n=1 Tax=Pseudomonas sp. zfem003 TaxID=3078198 RepID=UPI002927841F|nr:hypothetical protein [Pseudomonas sp. zfem003]MDU9399276.1 hypothetical protein [Pseudomonas sp. zfem003]
MTFTLILFLYAGVWADGDSMTATNVPGFKTEEACEAAGRKAAQLVSSTKKESRFICVQQ